VDYFLRPKLAWYAIARELRPVTFGISRTEEFKDPVLLPKGTDSLTVHSIPHLYGEKSCKLNVWGVNSTLETVQVPLKLELFDIASGEKIFEKASNVILLPNQSTESLSLDITDYNPKNVVASVSFKLPSGETLRSSADWPQPLKYLDFSYRDVSLSIDGNLITLASVKPIKSIWLDVEGDDDSGLEWSDNGFDIMPGEPVKVIAKGVGNRKVLVHWYGRKQ
jgi:beta-mannosidase